VLLNVSQQGHNKVNTLSALPLPVKRALLELGADIRDARRRRRIPMALMAERAGIGRMTLIRIEKGDPAVSMGGYARVLFVLGLAARLGEIADACYDPTGLALDEEHLPRRTSAGHVN
jgi:transcriptional regulator with XRE-family HTH domain